MKAIAIFFRNHKTFFLSIGFLVVFAVTVSYATPPSSPYTAGQTLDPQCAPGSANCSITPPAASWGSITGSITSQPDLAAALAAKEPTIAAGTTTQYFRGDKTFQTLDTSAVPENGNLYFTAARVQAVGDARYPQLTGSYADPSWITSLSFSKLTNTPTTLNGYGITDAYTKTQSDANYLSIAGGTISGTNGAGFLGLTPQTSVPVTPTSGVKLYSRSTGGLSWIGTNGYTRTFTGTNLTADHTYALPNADITIAGLENNQTFSGTDTFSTAPTLSSLTTGSIPYIGAGGLVSQANSNLFYNSSTQELGIGTNTPTAKLSVTGGIYTTPTSYSYDSYTAFGDSITAGTGASVPANDYVNRLAADLSLTANDRGVGGYQAADEEDNVYAMIVSPNSSQLITYMIGTNDMGNYGTNTDQLANFKSILLANEAWLTIPNNNKILGQSSGVTYTGTWTNSSYYGGALGKYSAENGDTATFTTTGTTAYIAYTMLDGNAGTFSVTVDGTNEGSYTSYGQNNSLIATSKGRTYGSGLIRIPGLSSGNHTVVLTVTSATGAGNQVFFDWAAGNSGANMPTGPTIIEGGVPQDAAMNPALPTYDSIINANISNLQADGLNIHYVDTTDAINTSTDLIPDGIHPNDLGHSHLAAAFLAVIQSVAGVSAPTSSNTLAVNSSTGNGQFVISSGGYAGIGTSTPTSPLTIQAPASSYDYAGLSAQIASDGNATTTGWTGSIANGYTSNTGNTAPLTFPIAGITAGNTYQVSFFIQSFSAGTISVNIGGVSLALNSTTAGMNQFIPQVTSNQPLTFTPSSTFNGIIKNISVTQVTSELAPVESFYSSDGVKSLEIRVPKGLNSIALGVGAGVSLGIGGTGNTLIGFQSGYSTTSGYDNTFIGMQSGYYNTTGHSNIYFGDQAGYFSTTAASNTFLGTQAGYSDTSGSHNNFIGSLSGYSNTTGHDENFIGYQAGYSTTTGTYNNFLGYQAGYNNTTGLDNTFIGYQSGYMNSTAHDDNFLGYQAGYSTTTDSSSNFFGNSAGYSDTTGNHNNFIGSQAGYSTTTGHDNNLFGYQSGYNNIGGTSNQFFGYQAGYSNTTGSFNIVLGANVDVPSATTSGQLNIGNLLFGTGLYQSSSVLSNTPTAGMLAIGTSSPSSRFDITTTALGVTQTTTSGLSLNNTTAAALGTQQISPAIRFTGQGWGTSAGTSQAVNFREYAVPVQGTVPTGYLTWEDSINGGSYVSAMAVTSGGNLGLGTTSPGGVLTITGNRTASAWGTAGIDFQTGAATYTDSSTAASTTVATNMVNTFGVPTLAASNTAVTYTAASTLYIAGAPIAGTNVTITNPYALDVVSGNSLLAGNLQVGGVFQTSSVASNGNFETAGGGIQISNTTNGTILFGGASSVSARSIFNGQTASTLTANNSYSNVIVGSSPITTPATGTNAMLANLVVNPIGIVTPGGAAITNTASLYIGGASTAGTNNYALDVVSGLSLFGSTSVTTGTAVATFQNAGGTCTVTPSTTGGITCSSDMNLKKNITNISDNSPWSFNTNITPASQSILDKVLALNPVDYNWNIEQDTDPKHAGFIAQEVEQVFPDLVTTDPATGLLSLNYTGLVPYTIEAIKEMNLNITGIDDMSTSNTWRDALIKWLADSANGITNIFSKNITSDQDTTNQLCVKDANGETCLNRSQIDQILSGQNNSQNNSGAMTTTVISSSSESDTNSDSSSDGTETPDVTAPIITTDVSADTTTQSADTSADADTTDTSSQGE